MPAMAPEEQVQYWIYNEDCVAGCKRHVADDSVDLIVTDPPYGIDGDQLHRHYHRKEEYVVDGYIEVSRVEYPAFTRSWIRQAERILRPGGSLYVVSGYTHLVDILNALRETSLVEVNHLIWKFNFGVYTTTKYVSAHYHILFYTKPGGPHTFETYCRYGAGERDSAGGSLNYQDREDVWIIPREYKPGRKKNKNELPTDLLVKIVQYSSREGDTVCDLFLGGFSTARVALGLRRNVIGFELSPKAFKEGMARLGKVVPGDMLACLRQPVQTTRTNQNKRWSESELATLAARYDMLRADGLTKKEAIAHLCEELGRGRFAILNALDRLGPCRPNPPQHAEPTLF